ncbi:biotin attachment protein [Candidatus Acetothermia bacterium]|nr:biotin attachment protein [Candidatus Acetothermia bacterium]
MQKKIHLKNRDRIYELALESKGVHHRLSIKEPSMPETTIQADASLQADQAFLTTQQGRFVCAVAQDANGIWVGCQGHVEYFEIERKVVHKKTEAKADNELRAPMTGRVISVRVQPGQTVQAGDVVAILEAMKMEFRIEAPYAAQIEKVTCRQGDLVDLGQVLVTLGAPLVAQNKK